MSRFTDAVSTLQERLTQTVETVTRTSRIDFVSGSVDEIDPPEDLDEFADYAKNTGIVRKNLRKFVNDVWEPGYRLEGPDETVAYFMGEQEDLPSPPEQTPENGFLDNAAIYAGEKHQDFSHFAKECSWQRWVRGTVTVELLKAEPENPDSPIHGFNFIPPETLYPQVFANSNILLPPDPEDLPENFDTDGVETTKRGEIAAYIQFDDESIIGRRFGGIDADAVPLSQNDVKKQTLEPDIGNPRGTKNERGVFGSSILEAINEEIEEYKSFKRDWATAIKTKSNGLWTAQFNKEVDELPNGQVEITEWDTDDMDALTNEIDNSGPGDIVTHDGNIELDRLTGEVPELGPVLQHYVDEISAPLPAPKFMVGFADDINRDITKEQAPDYDQTVENEREFQSNWWTELLRFVARRNGLDAEGLEFIVGPEPSDNPIESLDQAEIKKIQTYAAALNELAGPKGGLTTLVDRETLLTEVAMLPESATGDMDTPEIEADAETQQEFEELFGLDAESLADAGEIDRTPPEAAQRAAQAVVDALESDEKETDALTDVGKKRARQLADGEELSNDVLSKMSQFARHQGNTEYANWSDVPESKKGADAENPWYADNGTVAWFAWGGKSGVEWAQEQFDKVESAGVTYDVLAETVVDPESLAGPDKGNAEALDQFQPELHPRDDEGKFTEKIGGGLSDIRDAFVEISKTVDIGDESVEAGPVLAEAFQRDETEIKQAALDQLDDSFIEESTFGADTHGAKREFTAWREEQDHSLLNDDTAELWGAAIDSTGNDNIPEDAVTQPDTVGEALPAFEGEEPVTAIGDNLRVTQDVLRKVFGDTVPVTRGVTGEFAEELRGARENGESIEIEHRALESWSTFPEHARQFAEEGDGDGVLITTEIPVERVFGASHTTPGLTEEEAEIVAALDETVEYTPDQIHDATDEGLAGVYDGLVSSLGQASD